MKNAKKIIIPIVMAALLFLVTTYFLRPLDAPNMPTGNGGNSGSMVLDIGSDVYSGFPFYFVKRMYHIGSLWGIEWKPWNILVDFGVFYIAVLIIFRGQTFLKSLKKSK